jgi:hypothetical protein
MICREKETLSNAFSHPNEMTSSVVSISSANRTSFDNLASVV